MKANEALEKIYLQEPTKVRTEKKYDNDVEYIRTDAFIEKSRKWFEKQTEWLDLNGKRHCDMESFEDFRKYMEGEQVMEFKYELEYYLYILNDNSLSYQDKVEVLIDKIKERLKDM